jgi:hypothetical protein
MWSRLALETQTARTILVGNSLIHAASLFGQTKPQPMKHRVVVQHGDAVQASAPNNFRVSSCSPTFCLTRVSAVAKGTPLATRRTLHSATYCAKPATLETSETQHIRDRTRLFSRHRRLAYRVPHWLRISARRQVRNEGATYPLACPSCRTERNAFQSSSAKIFGCSKAAKWPPWSTLFQ